MLNHCSASGLNTKLFAPSFSIINQDSLAFIIAGLLFVYTNSESHFQNKLPSKILVSSNSPFWDIRAGLHHSFGESANRDWTAIGFKGLAPYWFEVDAALHLGDNGRTAFDLEVEYELLLTQRLVLQPRLDIAAFGKTDKELGRGSGLSTIKAGARLRYEFDRQFAPYLGVERVRRFGETADLLPLGSSRTETHWVLGMGHSFTGKPMIAVGVWCKNRIRAYAHIATIEFSRYLSNYDQ